MAIWCVWHVGIWRNNDINDVCLLWYYPVSFVIRRFQILKQLNPEAMYGKCILMTSFHWGLTGSYCWFGLYWIMPIHITLNANSTGINWPLSLESWPQVMRYVLSSHGVGGSIEVPEKVPGDTCGINRWSNYLYSEPLFDMEAIWIVNNLYCRYTCAYAWIQYLSAN